MVLEAQAHNTSISEAAVIALWQLISWQKRVEDWAGVWDSSVTQKVTTCLGSQQHN